MRTNTIDEFPWQISFSVHVGGSTIINKKLVITATKIIDVLPSHVVAGAHHRILEEGHQKRETSGG